MIKWKSIAGAAFVVVLAAAGSTPARATAFAQAQGGALSPAYLDQLLAQVLLCSGNPSKVSELDAWLKQMSKVKGSALPEGAEKAGFEPSFVALAPFPQVVELMAGALTRFDPDETWLPVEP